ncbi:MAG TPA: hypothetical protein VFM34_12140 [Moraxellaceae bacterium]|nr:hypothetical protein [Moraxellaceae bacterium]
MNLLVLLLVLGLRQTEPGRNLSQVIVRQGRQWRDLWLTRAARERWNSGLAIGLVMLPAVILLAVVVALKEVPFHHLFVGALGLVVMVVVMLDRDVPDALQRESLAWRQADEQARDVISQADPVALEEAANAELARARRALLGEQLRQLFAPLFWFLLLGPVAALTYYLLRLCTTGDESSVSALAGRLLHLADWPVARVLALSFALAGDFTAAWQHFTSRALDTGIDAVTLVDESAAVAQVVSVRMAPSELPGEQLVAGLSVIGALVHRALVIWIVLLALHTLWP